MALCGHSAVAGMDARFGGKDGLGGKLGAGKGKWQGSHKDGAVPVQIGLRVRNHANGHCGEVVACRGRTAGTFRVLSDNGQEWEWEVKRFVTEEGWPLQDVGEMPATIGMRIRCWMDNRTGRIAYIHNDWPQRIWVEFDDGEENEKDVTWFVCEEGGNPVGPGLTEKEWRYAKSGKSSPPQRALPARTTEYQSWSYQSSAGKGGHGMAQDWSSPSKGRSKDDFKDEYPPRARGGNAYSWNWEASKGKDGDRTQRRTGAAEKGKGPTHSYGGSSADLEEEALREVIDQVLDESNNGRVWITNWPGRFQAKLGQLREFLERHPDKFTVMAQGGRRYTVAFANANAAAKGSKEKGKGRAAPKKMEWKKSQKTDGDGDTAGGTDASEKVPRSVRRSDEEDPDATAFDVEPAEDAVEAEAEEPEV